MAAADYRLCDVCDGKAFYDANLNYNFDGDKGEPPVRFAGVDDTMGCRLDYLGDWAVLCEDCAKTHSTAIVANDKPLVPLPDREALAERLYDLHMVSEGRDWHIQADALIEWMRSTASQKGAGDE